MDSGLPSESIVKMICLPSVARHQGISLVTPRLDQTLGEKNTCVSVLKGFLDSLGGYIECETEHVMNAMMIPAGLMGPMYGILRNNRDWLVKQGVPAKDASYFIARQYLGMMQDAVVQGNGNGEASAHRFDDLIQEQTPGGLNEQALGNLKELGVFDAYDTAMNALLSRLEGRSDGSLEK
jgi:pyrroline-5-carboxylate reductase